jgi:hypothetical protein
MWKWPIRIALASVVLFVVAPPLGEHFDDAGHQTGFAAVMTLIAAGMWICAWLAAPLSLLLALAAIFNRQGGSEAWTWRGSIVTLAYLAWLGLCFCFWLAAHLGGGGLNGPCEPGTQEHTGTCHVHVADWPPLSSRVVINGPDGHFEDLYPDTVGLITIVAIALLPLALWPAARWLTRPERRAQIPLQRLGWLVTIAAGTSLLYSAFVDDSISRPLTGKEQAELRADAALGVTRSPSRALPAAQPEIEPTHVQIVAVENLVSQERGGGRSRCATASPTGFGLWTCATTTPDSSVFPARLRIAGDGSFVGKYVGHDGRERPFRGCCVAIHP